MAVTRRRASQVPEQTGTIAEIAPGSLADQLGLLPGDRIVTVNGRRIEDALDFQFLGDADDVTLEVHRGEDMFFCEVELDDDDAWGITFADPTFDGIYLCENACPFCFVKQMPKGMRKSLYVMDDDFRYSMLYGSFITLTNLTEDDWRRIEEQHISPINVSVHSTDPELRSVLVGNPKGALIMEHLARLERMGIDYNTQLVLCPGINDGPELDRTITELLTTGPHLLSIAGVPVGISRFGKERQSKRLRASRPCNRALPGALVEIRRHTPEEAEGVIDQAERWQEQFRRERGRTFFYLGDEFYLMTGRPIPSTSHYDGFPQVEDGIGITRLFINDAERIIKRGVREPVDGLSAAIACGTLIEPTMRRLVEGVNERTGSRLRVIPIVNSFLGPEINVSGLLTGGLIQDAFSDERSGDPIFISQNMISKRTGTFLDDLTVKELEAGLGRSVIAADYLSQVLHHLSKLANPVGA